MYISYIKFYIMNNELFESFRMDYYGSFLILVSFQWKAPQSYWEEMKITRVSWEEMKITRVSERCTTKVFKEYFSVN